jgi:hypothetical protein
MYIRGDHFHRTFLYVHFTNIKNLGSENVKLEILGHLWGPLTLHISKMWGRYWLHLNNRK